MGFGDGALWDAIRHLQKELKCRQKCLGILPEGSCDPTLFLNQCGEWVTTAAGGLTFENGLTETSGTVKLGGDIIETTILSYDPSTESIILGDLDNEKVFVFGSIEDSFTLLASGMDSAIIGTSDSPNNDGAQITLNKDDDSGFASMGFSVLSQTEDYGLYIFDNGGQKTANIYYAISDGMGNTTDISRIEANKYKVHARKIIDPTGVIPNYNGYEASDTYSQLEYNKTAEDGQTSGYCFTLDTNGATLYINGTNYFRVEPDGDTVLNGRFQEKKGANVASASAVTFGDDGNVFIITGTTTIQQINSTNWQAGSIIILVFQSTAGVKHAAGSAGANKEILLNGSTDLIGAANNVLQLVFDGTQWQEVSRKQP